jgi:hypothetical protein
MKVALAHRYRMWMLVLLPATGGVGTIALWLRTLQWPLRIDRHGVTLRYRRRIDWHSITKIGLSRSYLDGHCAQLRIHHAAGTCKVPLDALRDGQGVVAAILTMFDQARARRGDEDGQTLAGGASDEDPVVPHDARSPAYAQDMQRMREAISHRQRQGAYGAGVIFEEGQA